ncbi:MAG: DUF3298 domain-containing protein [Caulobacter sp.]|nr:DUF3298 domain-containing protein [Caulobacter sp.]
MKTFAAAPLAALALVSMLAACDRKPAEAPKAPAAASPAAPPAAPARPLTFQQADPAAKVALSLPAEIGRYPVLHTTLYDREVAQLKDFAAKAEADRKAADGQFPWRQYESQRQWFAAATTPKLVGLRALWFDYTGGAHPNHGGASLLWDAAANTEIKPAALFRPDADMKALDKAICDAVAAAKSHREGAVPLNDMFACPKWSETVLVLAPSTQADKIGGLTVLIDPYVVGPYAEGDYELTIPLSAFQGLLAPAYADAFAGAPKSPGNPDGTLSVKMDVK